MRKILASRFEQVRSTLEDVAWLVDRLDEETEHWGVYLKDLEDVDVDDAVSESNEFYQGLMISRSGLVNTLAAMCGSHRQDILDEMKDRG